MTSNTKSKSMVVVVVVVVTQMRIIIETKYIAKKVRYVCNPYTYTREYVYLYIRIRAHNTLTY